MTISTLDIAAFKQFVSKFSQLSKEEDLILLLNYPLKGKLMVDFQFGRTIEGEVYDPIHFIKYIDSISSDDVPRLFEMNTLMGILQTADETEDILEIAFEKAVGKDDDSEKAVITTITGDDRNILGFVPVSDARKSCCNIDAEAFDIDVKELSVKSDSIGNILYESSAGDWLLQFALKDPGNYEEARQVLACFIGKYAQMPALEVEKERNMGVAARRARKNEESPVITEITKIDITPGSDAEGEAGACLLPKSSTDDVPVVQDPETVQSGKVSEDSDGDDAPPVRSTKRKRRSKEEILREKLEDATAILKDNGYYVNSAGPGEDTATEETMGAEDLKEGALALFSEITKAAIGGQTTIPDYLDIGSELLSGVWKLLKTAGELERSAQKTSFSLRELQEMSITEFAKIVEGV